MTKPGYIISTKAAWYWTTILLAAATTATVFTVSEDAYPLVYIRYALGAVYVVWLPGYTFTRAMFPVGEVAKKSKENPDTLERIALSIGLSLALDAIVGLLLNQTPWGLRLTPIVLSLLALTTTSATVAVVREHHAEKRQPDKCSTAQSEKPDQKPFGSAGQKRQQELKSDQTSPAKADPRQN